MRRHSTLLFLLLGFAVVGGRCNETDDPIVEIAGCSSIDGERYACFSNDGEPPLSQARCMAHLLRGEITACTFTSEPGYNAERMIQPSAAFDRLGECRTEPDALGGTKYFCSGPALTQCRKFQRGGAAVSCVDNDSGLSVYEPRNAHLATIEVRPNASRTLSQSNGQVDLRWVVPAAPPPRGECNPAQSLGSCDRGCRQLNFKSEPEPNSTGIFSIGPEHACVSPTEQFSVGQTFIPDTKVADDYTFEAEICRETARLNQQSSGSFTLRTIKASLATAMFCFNDPITFIDSGSIRWGNQCAWVERPAIYAVPFELTCVLAP